MLITSKSACPLLIVLLLIGGLTILSVSVPVHAGSITVPDDYPMIQQAINAASEGDEIFVKAGLYHEAIVVDETVALRGENREATVLSSGDLQGVTVSSSNVEISGFTIRDCPRTGISILSNSCLITDNNIIGILNFGGILLDGRNTQVEGNVIFNNSIIGNDDDGITMMNAKRNYVIGNNISENHFVGLYLYSDSSFNVVSDNEFTGNWDAGIIIALNSDHNEIINNSISGSGMNPSNPFPLMFGCGIGLITYACSNRLMGNLISNNYIGVLQDNYANDNLVYRNSFITNTRQFANSGSPAASFWDNGYPIGGNYWSDYNGTDVKKGSGQDELGSDGIGDVPYVLDEYNVDHYPLMQPHVRLRGDVDDNGKVDMMDVGLVVLAGIFFSLSWAFVSLCERVRDAGPDTF